jgi:hypothetical protein
LRCGVAGWLVVLASGIEVCKQRNAQGDPRDQFDFDDYERLQADMVRGFGDIGWWLDTADMTAEQTARRIVAELTARTVMLNPGWNSWLRSCTASEPPQDQFTAHERRPWPEPWAARRCPLPRLAQSGHRHFRIHLARLVDVLRCVRPEVAGRRRAVAVRVGRRRRLARQTRAITDTLPLELDAREVLGSFDQVEHVIMSFGSLGQMTMFQLMHPMTDAGWQSLRTAEILLRQHASQPVIADDKIADVRR